jgi:hypothetical protein
MPPPDCDADPAGICPTLCSGVCVEPAPWRTCFGARDEQTCVAHAACEAVYAGSRCFCDDKGCGCLAYTFDGCRDRRVPPTCAGSDLVGAWRSGDGPEGIIDRTYRFEADGSFVIADEIAPCPPDAVCVWSGIIENRGAWRRDDGGAVTLTYREPLQRWDGLRFARTLKHAGCPAPELVEVETGRAFTPLTR